MNEFNNIQNKNLLIKASINMLKDKLNITLSHNDENFKKTFDNIFETLFNKYKDNTIELKKINTFFLNNIKNAYQNNNNIIKKEQHIDKEPEKENKLNDDYLDIKIKELEEIRSIVPDYDNIDVYNNNISKKNIDDNNEKTNESSTLPTSIINYNNIVNTKAYKSFVISSINRDWILKQNRNNIDISLNLDIDYKIYNYIPDKLLMPSFLSLLTPLIKMKITASSNEYYYNFICSEKNKNWDTWTSLDEFEFNLNNKNLNLIFYDINNDLIDLGYDNIKIISYNKETKNDYNYFKLFLNKNLNIFNNFNIYENIIINANNKLIKQNVYNIDNNNNNSIYIIDFKKEINNLENTTILKYNDQFTLIIKYYIK
jgi:hypothetical protein|uniref:Uncharacterized protein n=1 Tax=viral metagenome TaxID=1070528 RepID=A0A6C0JRC0_9ZZZZ